MFLFPTRNPCCFASVALTCFWISRCTLGQNQILTSFVLDFVPRYMFLFPTRNPCCFASVALTRIPAERFLCNGNEISHYTRKPRPVKGRGNISETTCYCILTYDLYAPVVTRRIRQNLLIFDLSACNSEVIFNHLLLAPVLHRHRLALPFTNDLLSSS